MAATLLTLSGPSCVGKGPLVAALRRCVPELAIRQPVVHTSRSPRPGERDGVDFHFRTADELRAYDPADYFVYPMRNQMRAIDAREMQALLAAGAPVIVELHPARVASFLAHPLVAAATAEARVETVLLQPLTMVEVARLCAFSGRDEVEATADVMRAKQVQRALGMGKLLTADELADIEIRARAAWDEFRDPTGFRHVLVNHDAEGCDHWRHTPPIGDAGRTLDGILAILGYDLR